MVTVRREKDSMGAIEVPADKLWGAQTQRSLEHFRISTEKMPVSLIHALALTKRAAAKVNQDLGLLAAEKASAIIQAADEVLAGKHADEFPLAIWQTGSGTQSNMNMNEVLANRASEILGGVRGMERKVHPNDDVNKSQSSNDVFPTAMHVAALLALREHLIPQLSALTDTLRDKSHAFADIVKIGRTHLQDATPLTLGQEISGWVAMLEHNLRHIEHSLPHVAELALGGTAVGTGRGPDASQRTSLAIFISEAASPFNAPCACTNASQVASASNLLGAVTNGAAVIVASSSATRRAYSGWVSRCGIGEIAIPENEPGSSIMPGKVNPTQCEAVTMLCCQVMGNDVAINMGGASGNFELNVYRPMVIHNFLQTVRLLADGMESFNKHCASGIEPNRERITQLLNESLMLVTALNTHIGYDKAAEIAKKAHKEGLTLKASAVALGYLSDEEFDAWVRPELMVGSMTPGR
ncbi:class II fumarate hydratase [Salmonella enterica]|nr:class II fumarate hydratase [Salmonella enterica]EGU0311912.1 class II fumarate hydratase [Salmonella enterica]